MSGLCLASPTSKSEARSPLKSVESLLSALPCLWASLSAQISISAAIRAFSQLRFPSCSSASFLSSCTQQQIAIQPAWSEESPDPRQRMTRTGPSVDMWNQLTVIVVFTWPYFLGSLARFLSSLSWLSLDISQQESSAYLCHATKVKSTQITVKCG